MPSIRAGRPRWTAFHATCRANLMFRGLALAPGRHEIVFTYRPAAWRLGAAIGLIALAALVAAVTATYVRRRRKP